MSDSREHVSYPWTCWIRSHVTRHELHHLCSADMYNAPPCKSGLNIMSLNDILTKMKAAITAPDPDISDNARDYFIRCMRLLEQCTPSWPMESMRKQIDALREAFSADTSKPFDLKSAFPFGSPLSQPSELPIGSTGSFRQSQLHQVPLDPPSQVSHTTSYPLTSQIPSVGKVLKTNSSNSQPI